MSDILRCERCGAEATGPLCDKCSHREFDAEMWKQRERIDNSRAVLNVAREMAKGRR